MRLFASDLIYHNLPPEVPPTRERFIKLAIMYRTAFPDLHFTTEDLIAEGDKLVIRWTFRGTHKVNLWVSSQLADK